MTQQYYDMSPNYLCECIPVFAINQFAPE